MAEEKTKRFTKRNLPASVRRAVEAALARKAEDLCVLDLREISSFTDFFVIAHGNSSRQNAAVAEAVEVALKAAGLRALSVEGRQAAEWILLDYGWFVAASYTHLTLPTNREV